MPADNILAMTQILQDPYTSMPFPSLFHQFAAHVLFAPKIWKSAGSMGEYINCLNWLRVYMLVIWWC